MWDPYECVAHPPLLHQRADTLARAIAELRGVGDIESAEAEVYAARTSAGRRVATHVPYAGAFAARARCVPARTANHGDPR
jgi:hypothetical protein